MENLAEELRKMTEEAQAAGDSAEQAARCLELESAAQEYVASYRVAYFIGFAEAQAKFDAARGECETHVMKLDEGDYEEAEGNAEAVGRNVTLVGVARAVSAELERRGLEVFIRPCDDCGDLNLWVRW